MFSVITIFENVCSVLQTDFLVQTFNARCVQTRVRLDCSDCLLRRAIGHKSCLSSAMVASQLKPLKPRGFLQALAEQSLLLAPSECGECSVVSWCASKVTG
jgi:hypothetical protein